eukprot:SAG22_NODE_14470_length_374_cov_0.738182_1_plen_103_part_01
MAASRRASGWAIEPPSLILEVTGDAMDFELRPDHKDLFASGLVIAGEKTRAWVVTGGTDAGIMKAVGDALGAYHSTIPCIGVAPWGITRSRNSLAVAAAAAEA